MAKTIYLDNAATTRTRAEVAEAMFPYFTQYYGNPSSVYEFSAPVREAMMRARETIAKSIHARMDEIYFTGGGSEADNWALTGIAESYGKDGGHIITTKVEHHAVLHTCKYLEERGFAVTYLDVDENGFVRVKDVEEAIRPDTILISVMAANNEVGTIEPIEEIGALARSHGILFHTDAVQAFAHIPIDVQAQNIDLLSASAHKLGGPKGVGFLYIRRGVKLRSFVHGGAQERGRRAGTENVPGIVGFGKAVELAMEELSQNMEREGRLRDHLIERVLTEVPYARLTGSSKMRLPGSASFVFQFLEGQILVIRLDMEGICASSGSACTSGSPDPSHVLLAMGLPREAARGSLRLTLGHDTTMEDVDRAADCIREIAKELRGQSVLYEKFLESRN